MTVTYLVTIEVNHAKGGVNKRQINNYLAFHFDRRMIVKTPTWLWVNQVVTYYTPFDPVAEAKNIAERIWLHAGAYCDVDVRLVPMDFKNVTAVGYMESDYAAWHAAQAKEKPRRRGRFPKVAT